MAAARPGGREEFESTERATGAARVLAVSMPRLILEARRISATLVHGLHGRRRAGPGEKFWQFRRFVSGEEARRIDWRRSARDEHLYVREQEWQAAHTVWIWPDRSPSMQFTSHLAQESKLERTLVLAFALAEVLVEAGERVGIPGLMRPTGSRAVIERMADAIVHDPAERPSLPQGFSPAALAEIILLSDLWSPIENIRATLKQLSTAGAQGHVLQIVDPAEELFPYSGRVEFIDPEDGHRVIVGRAEVLRGDYMAEIARFRADVRAETDRLGWSFAVHHTDRLPNDVLYALQARIGEGNQVAAASARQLAALPGGHA
jgi:uncharacterized protein (DUF58 family)